MTTSLSALETLARQRSGGKRRLLLRAVTDCFFEMAERRTETELELFDEVMQRVLADVEPTARAELAERLADVDSPPPNVLRRLAADLIDVAEPILLRSRALKEGDLVQIAGAQSQAHLEVIARRPMVSELVTDVLVERGNEQVLDTIIANHGARFSDHGFAALAARATGSEALRYRLVARRDLPEQIVEQLLPQIREAVRNHLRAVGVSLEDTVVDALVAQSRGTLLERLQAARKVARPFVELRALVTSGTLTLDDAVGELADADTAVDVARLIGDRVGLRQDVVLRALRARSDEPGAVMCRAAGLGPIGYSSVLRMRRRRDGGLRPSDGLGTYSTLSEAAAHRTLQFLKARAATRH